MKNYIHASAFACALIGISVGLAASPARAMEGNETVRAAQMRLTDLGFYAGPYDGVAGPLTNAAILQFQHVNHIAGHGHLTAETKNLLWGINYAAHHNGYYGYRTGYVEPMTAAWYGAKYVPAYSDIDHTVYYNPPYYNAPAAASPIDWSNRWSYAHTQNIPNRFASLDITEEDRGSLRHYVVTLNGRAVLFANNQPSILRVSHTFSMDAEDAIVFTAYHGDGKCAYKNYLLSMRADGTTVGPREIGDCSGSFEGHVADNALIMTFPDRPSSWGFMDMWRYENGSLTRI